MASFDRPKRDTRSRAKQLTPAELRFVELIGGGSSLAEAVTTLGKSPRTLRRWKSRPEIAEAIRARTNAGLALARATLASAANRSARELIRLAEKAKPDAVRVAACKAVLEEAVKLGSLQDLEAAVAELEARLGTTGGRP